jgi:hypothetical protein
LTLYGPLPAPAIPEQIIMPIIMSIMIIGIAKRIRALPLRETGVPGQVFALMSMVFGSILTELQSPFDGGNEAINHFPR